MVKNNRIIQAVCLFAVLALLVIFCAVSVSAITPPVNSETTAQSYTRILGRPTSLQVLSVIQVINYQSSMGSFNSYYPSLLVYNESSNAVDLYLTSRTNDIRYSLSDGVFVATNEAISVRSYFTSIGFYEHVPALRLNNVDPALVLAYRSADENRFIVNDSFSSGSGYDNTNIQLVNSAISSWRDFYTKVYNYDSNLENAWQDGYETGYDDGYETGFDDGYETGYDDGYAVGNSEGFGSGLYIGRQEGYETGFDDGYDFGYDVGFDDGYETGFDDGYETGYDDGIANGESSTTVIEITENIDVGSIISALPEGAKAIIDGALGFEIFGINVAGTLTAILVVAIVGFVIKWLMTR